MTQRPDDLPESLLRLWGRDTTPAPKRRAALTVIRVVEAAVQIADDHGLPAVSMSRVAEQLGVTTMALYRHVDSKDELLTLMVDVAAGDPPDLPLVEGWRAATEAWARALLEAYGRHLWIAQVPLAGPPIGPHEIAWVEAGLRALRDTGLGPVERLSSVVTLAGYVRQNAALTGELERSRDGRDWAEVENEYGRRLASLVEADRFPEITQVIAAGAFGPVAAGAAARNEINMDFDFGLARFLDGIELHGERRAASPSDPRPGES